jgi:hypothetical protein
MACQLSFSNSNQVVVPFSSLIKALFITYAVNITIKTEIVHLIFNNPCDYITDAIFF